MIVNGVTLPDVPVDVLAQYPYAVIVSQDYLEATGPIGYLMYATKSEILYASAEAFGGANATINSFGTGYEVYTCFSDGTSYPDKWTRMDEQCSETDMFSKPVGEYVINDNATAEYAVVWANHDIKEVTGFDPGTGEFLFGDTYFADSSAPVAPSPTRYSIAKAILDAVARQIMRLTDSTAKVKPEEFEAKLASVSKGSSLQIGRATTTLRVSFDTTASGKLT